MSVYYDFEKRTMISLASVTISLSVGLLLIQYAHGQDTQVQAQTVTQNSSEVTTSILNNLGTLVTIVSTMIGISGGLFGYVTFRKNEKLKRQEIIFPLIEEFEKKRAILYARELIDGVPITLNPSDIQFDIPIKLDSKNLKKYYSTDLSKLTGSVYDDDDVILMKIIMDSLLNFFGKLGYLIDNKLITKKRRQVFFILYRKGKK